MYYITILDYTSAQVSCLEVTIAKHTEVAVALKSTDSTVIAETIMAEAGFKVSDCHYLISESYPYINHMKADVNKNAGTNEITEES